LKYSGTGSPSSSSKAEVSAVVLTGFSFSIPRRF
jgi:hypothetical protein